MKIQSIRTLGGPNVYSHQPVLVMRLDLEGLTDEESRDVPGFNERLLETLPGLRAHHCSKGREGGFVERLVEGTYFGHVIEHVALELMHKAGAGTTHGKTRYAGVPGIYNVVVEYTAEQGTRYLLGVAVEMVEALLRNQPVSFDEKIEEAKRIIAETELGPSTRAIVEAAERRGIPWFRINQESLVQLGYGKNRKLIQAAMSSETSAIGIEIAGDKDLMKKLLDMAAIPVPRGNVVQTETEAIDALDSLRAPVVVKPLDGRQGKGVSLNLSTPEDVVKAFHIAREFSPSVIVEEELKGKNYRVLVVKGAVVAASERVPCHIVGDGVRTIAELIEIENQNPLRGEGHDKPLTKITTDAVMLAYLQKINFDSSYVPAEGEIVFLREGINLSTGGSARDVTDEVHRSISRMCVRAAQIAGLDICGVDLMLPDISLPMEENAGGGIIELNAAPGLRMHIYPSEGQSRDVGGAIIEMLYPENAPSRIPIISLTGTNGKTTVTRMIGHVLEEMRHNVGMTTTDGIWIGGECIERGDTTGPYSARVVLSDPSVEVAVLETARGGIVRRGLGYDWSDISVMTNISADHIGQDGIESVEDLVYIKSLIAERVREGGTLILNADNEHLARIMERDAVARVEKKIIYFSLVHDNPVVRSHTNDGGLAYFVNADGWIIEACDHTANEMMRVSDIPVTMNGTAEFQISNAMAAIAACRAFGASCAEIEAALMSFRAEEHNPGRAGLYAVGGGYVLVDYGHNPEAFEAVCRMAARWTERRVTGIIGVPGDRGDELIREAGRVAARGFHQIIIKEDQDLRGRSQGEVAALLCGAVHEEAPERSCQVVLDEIKALAEEIEKIGDNDVIVIFYDQLEPVLRVLNQHGAMPVAKIRDVVAPPPPQLSLVGA
jgi:cyanophycin synthetase